MRAAASQVGVAILVALAGAACGGSPSGPSGDLHFPVTLAASQYTHTATGCDGSGLAVPLRSGGDLLVVDSRSRPVEHVRLPAGVVQGGQCRFAFQVKMPSDVQELWLATGGGASRTFRLTARKYVQRDGEEVSLTFTPKRG